MMANRASTHASTKCSPNVLIFGQEVRGPVDLMYRLLPGEEFNVCPIEYVEWVQHAMSAAFETAQRNLSGAAKRQISNYDQTFKTTHRR